MGRGSETQLQVGENLNYLTYSILAGLKLVKLTVKSILTMVTSTFMYVPIIRSLDHKLTFKMVLLLKHCPEIWT